MVYEGRYDFYKAEQVELAICAWVDDNCLQARLKSDLEGSKYINIPVELLDIMKAYFEGKTIEIKEAANE